MSKQKFEELIKKNFITETTIFESNQSQRSNKKRYSSLKRASIYSTTPNGYKAQQEDPLGLGWNQVVHKYQVSPKLSSRKGGRNTKKNKKGCNKK
jgi:hypothetical protein